MRNLWLIGMMMLCPALGMLANPAFAQVESREGLALQNQILELKRDVLALKNQGGGSVLGGTRPPSNSNSNSGGGEIAAQLLDRVTALEDLVRRQNGRLDELDNSSKRQNADLAKQIADMQFRLDNGGTAARPGSTGPAASTQSTPPAPLANAPSPRRTPELMLQEGNAALARRDYTLAESTARETLNAAKGQPRAYDAQFLLAQSLSGQRNYAQAAVAFGDTYERSKQGQHAQDALVGLASNLTALNERKSACAALDTLRAQYPQPRADVASRAATIRAQAGCR